MTSTYDYLDMNKILNKKGEVDQNDKPFGDKFSNKILDMSFMTWVYVACSVYCFVVVFILIDELRKTGKTGQSVTKSWIFAFFSLGFLLFSMYVWWSKGRNTKVERFLKIAFFATYMTAMILTYMALPEENERSSYVLSYFITGLLSAIFLFAYGFIKYKKTVKISVEKDLNETVNEDYTFTSTNDDGTFTFVGSPKFFKKLYEKTQALKENIKTEVEIKKNFEKKMEELSLN